MENNSWSKTLLGIYRYIPRVVYAYDKIVETRAYNSSFVSSCNSFNDTMVVADFILNMSDKKINLINLKLIIEKALKDMDYRLRSILIMKFIDGKKSLEIADKLGFSIRTFFRKLSLGLQSFKKCLVRLGYDDDKLFDLLKDEHWIMDLYYSYSEERQAEILYEEFELKRQLKTNIICDLKRLSAC